MFKNILVVCSEKNSETHLKTVQKVKEILNRTNFHFLNISELEEGDFSSFDLIISVGGDGTFIRTSHLLKETPILGINSDSETSEGVLMSLKENELERLKEILSGKFEIFSRERIQIIKNGKLIDKNALNEVFVGAEKQFHTLKYEILFNGKNELQRSSGILVVTPSGSTAWYKSAGGKPFTEDKLKFLIREPYFGRLFNPKLLAGEINNKEKIILRCERREDGIISIDSNLVYDFNFGDVVEIEMSDFPLRVLSLS